MNIKSVKKEEYKGEHCGYSLTTNDNKVWSVPLDENNRHYQNILQWVADGNTIQEAD